VALGFVMTRADVFEIEEAIVQRQREEKARLALVVDDLLTELKVARAYLRAEPGRVVHPAMWPQAAKHNALIAERLREIADLYEWWSGR
jgi:polysaccharide deacetylase 2 family uncharacterized protein YibQ